MEDLDGLGPEYWGGNAVLALVPVPMDFLFNIQVQTHHIPRLPAPKPLVAALAAD